ncbi:MAG: hypothetical protein NXH72_06145 [Hyphomonadaceae bacterium]|nr:hypothetical protein [Hyphomonadaceae bacterium]
MKLGWPNVEMTTALSAVVVGVAALIVAVDQSNIARQQADLMEKTVQASVWPVVQFDFVADQDLYGAEASLSLRNSGVGPAIIKGIQVTRDGVPVARIEDYLLRNLEITQGMRFELDVNRGTGRVLSAGEVVAVGEARWTLAVGQIPSNMRDNINAYFAELNAIEGAICYCSVLDQCWINRTRDYANPEPVDACTDMEFGEF